MCIEVIVCNVSVVFWDTVYKNQPTPKAVVAGLTADRRGQRTRFIPCVRGPRKTLVFRQSVLSEDVWRMSCVDITDSSWPVVVALAPAAGTTQSRAVKVRYDDCCELPTCCQVSSLNENKAKSLCRRYPSGVVKYPFRTRPRCLCA